MELLKLERQFVVLHVATIYAKGMKVAMLNTFSHYVVPDVSRLVMQQYKRQNNIFQAKENMVIKFARVISELVASEGLILLVVILTLVAVRGPTALLLPKLVTVGALPIIGNILYCTSLNYCWCLLILLLYTHS